MRTRRRWRPSCRRRRSARRLAEAGSPTREMPSATFASRSPRGNPACRGVGDAALEEGLRPGGSRARPALRASRAAGTCPRSRPRSRSPGTYVSPASARAGDHLGDERGQDSARSRRPRSFQAETSGAPCVVDERCPCPHEREPASAALDAAAYRPRTWAPAALADRVARSARALRDNRCRATAPARRSRHIETGEEPEQHPSADVGDDL